MLADALGAVLVVAVLDSILKVIASP